jgi:hypothetical protein
MMVPEYWPGAPWRKSSRSGDASNCVEAVVIDTGFIDAGEEP